MKSQTRAVLDGCVRKNKYFCVTLHRNFRETSILSLRMSRLDLPYFLARRMAAPVHGRKRNVMVRIATLSVVVGMAVMIVALGVIFGFKRQITSKLTGFGAHVQLVNLDGNSSYETVPISIDQPVVKRIAQLDEVSALYPYAIKVGILKGEEAMQGVVLKGVGPDYDWSFFERYRVAGEVPRITDSARNKDAMISSRLASMMHLKVGDPFEMLFIQNPPRRDRFRVSGIYDTQFDELDKVMILTDLRNVQRLSGWDSTQVTGFEIDTRDFAHLDRFTARVDELVFDTPGVDDQSLRAVSIRERYPMIFDWLNAHNVNAAVIITVMLLVALFNMVSALLIILLERTPMIGVLKALGMDNRALQKTFVIRSAFILLKGMFWGNVLGLGLCLLQYYTGWVKLDQAGYFLTTVPIYLDWGWWALLNVVTFVLLVLLLTLPTLIISLILPEKSIRFE